jgi:hypothetical protein
VGEALEGSCVSRTSIRRIAVVWTAAMTAVGTIVGINIGTHKLTQADSANASQASVVNIAPDGARQQALQKWRTETTEEARQAALDQAAAVAASRRAAAARARAAAAAKAKAAAAAKAAREKAAAAAAARAKETSKPSRSEDRTPVSVEPGSAKDIARKKVAARGWSTSEFDCLVKLWDKESGWRVDASNPSGAYGIPQAKPGDKMAANGADWKTNPATQIEWGLDYITDRYGTPCDAWGHWQSAGWY